MATKTFAPPASVRNITPQQVIARKQNFVLVRDSAAADWLSMRLVRVRGRARKHIWRLGWNGTRLANGRDRRLLAAHEPGLYEWVVGRLVNWSGRE